MSGEQERQRGDLVPAGSDRALSKRSVEVAQRGLDLAQSLEGALQQPRVVRFPEDRSMGNLYVGSRHDREVLGEARGTVTVRAGNELKLSVSLEASRDLCP